MQKLKELLEKIKIQIATLKEKIPFLKKKMATESAPVTAPVITPTPKPKRDTTLAKIFRDGSFGMRFGVMLVVVLAIIFTVSISLFGKQIYTHWKLANKDGHAQKVYSDQFGGLASKVADSASIIGLGSVMVNAFTEQGKGIINLDVWVKCDGPKTAAIVQASDLKFHDRIVDVLQSLDKDKVDLRTEEGKGYAKAAIISAINNDLEVGKIIEVYFHNFVLQ